MSIVLPKDPRQRIAAMVAASRGYRAEYTVDGKRYVLEPTSGAYSDDDDPTPDPVLPSVGDGWMDAGE